MTRSEIAMQSIIKRYRKYLWSKFTKALKEYKLINAGDRVCVCISGGKDSMLMAKCIMHLQKYSKIPFTAEYVVMNPGYNQKNLDRIIYNASLLEIPIKVVDSNIFSVVDSTGGSPCYLCARMRRGCLYNIAKDLGCNKIALGHHYDDVIETILLSMLYGGEYKTMMPKLHSANFENMELIRPLYYIREDDIIQWAKYNELEFIRCACRFTEALEKEGNRSDFESESKRLEIKNLIKTLHEKNPNVEFNIFKSSYNVNMGAIIGYKDDFGNKHNFLDDYDL